MDTENEPDPNPQKMTEHKTSFWEDLVDVFSGIAIPLVTALTVWLFLRDQVLDAYVVPTASMEPCIEGDELHGDRVLVDKTFDNFGTIRRFDTIVFWHEEAKQIVVKRVAGLPGEYLEISDGDLYAGKEETSMRRIVKSLTAHRDMLASYWSSASGHNGFASERWKLDSVQPAKGAFGAALLLDGDQRTKEQFLPKKRSSRHWRRGPGRPFQMQLQGIVTSGYLDAFDKLHERSYPALDFGVAMHFVLTKGATLCIEIEKYGQRFTLQLGEAAARLLDRGTDVPLQGKTLPTLTAGKKHELIFMWLDGGLCLALDGEDRFRQEIPLRGERHRRANSVRIGVSSGKLTLERLDLVHDIHYLEHGHASFRPFWVPKGQYFLLGDNSKDSRDSRYFGPVPERDLRGRPLMIAAPLPRFRLFKR